MRALITGCSTGIGRATAIELTQRGLEVVATARRPDTLADLDVALTLALDVDSDESVAAVRDAAGDVDVLVNNAGFGVGGPVTEVPLDQVRRMYETNVFGLVRMVKAFVPPMRARGRGAVINVSSVSGVVAAPLSGFYSSTKYAVEAISQALHIEEGHFGIRTVVIQPGFIATAFGDNSTHYGEDGPPWNELAAMMESTNERLGAAERPGPELVATAIADAIDGKDTRLRIPVGVDAELVTAARGSMGDDEFEAAMREVVGLNW